MKLDPRGHRPPQRDTSPGLSGPALRGLVVEIRPLREIASWPGVGSRLEALSDAARGVGGVSRLDIDTLRRWAANWRRLDRRMRAFYAAHTDAECVNAALWCLLDGGHLTGPLRGALERLYLDDHGATPPWRLVPQPLYPRPNRSPS